MGMVEHSIDLHGPRVSNGRRSPEAVGTVLKWTERAARDSVSMAFRYTSRAPGRPPAWLAAASAIRFASIAHREDGTRLYFEAPRLRDAAEEVYRQRELFQTRPDGNDTAFDLLGDVVRDVEQQAADSCRFDRKLLGGFRTFRDAPSRLGIQALELRGGRLPQDRPGQVTPAVAERAVALQAATPRPVRVRLYGQLDMIRASDRSFELLLPRGEAVPGILVADERDRLRGLWRKHVVVEGRAVFRPSGSLLCLEAEGLALAEKADRFFSKIPKPRGHASAPLTARVARRQGPTTGAGAIFGQWPGEETDEEVAAALKDLD
ncbi:MAG: hypothetical protein ACOC8A_01140 [bacterium]